MNFFKSRLTLIAVGGIVLGGVLTGLCFLTTEADIVGQINVLMQPLGLIAALFGGLAFAKYGAGQMTTAYGNGLSTGFGILGGLIILLSGLLGMNAYIAGVGVVFILLALLAAKYAHSGQTPPTILKYFLVAAAFIGGVIPGLVIYFILSFIVSDRYCQLTSSKCL